MRHTDDSGETMEIEIEVPSLAFFAESAPPEESGDSAMLSATLADVGALVPGRDAWPQATAASAGAVDSAPAEGSEGASRFQFRASIPAIGQSRAFLLSVLRTSAALDGSGARRKPTLHPTEQILIRVTSAAPGAPDDPQTLMAPIPERPGAGLYAPGVSVVRAVSPAQGDGALTLEIQGE